ncbi:hypothetical protein GCM10028771_22740 [Nocardioides marmoraquaticus]
MRIGRVAGVDVLVTSSWLLVAGLIAVVLAPRIEVVQPGLGGLRYVAGVVFAVLLYLSVLLHEISHALVAQRFGLGVRSITLHFLGGATEIDRESESAKQEFWISVVGPLTSLAVGGAALALAPLSPEGLPRLAVEGLAVANLLVGVLNLVPGLPLDGGRVLRAVVWQVGGDQHRGTVAAAWGGRVVAVLVLLWPVVLELGYGVRADVLTYVVVLVLAAFLWAGATQQLAQARIRRRLPALDARRLARRALAVPDDLSVAEAVRRAQEAGAGGVVLLDRSERPAGVVSERALVATPAERRPWVPVTSVARTLEAGLLVPADLTGEELVRAMARLPAEEYVLVEPDGSIFGVLASTDVDRAFEETARS